MNQAFTLGLAQLNGRVSPKENLEFARDFAFEAAQKQVTLLAFPEMLMSLPRSSEPLRAIAEPPDGAFVTALAAIAREFRLHLLATFWERMPNEERVGNAAILLSPDGAALTTYRKLHLFDAMNVQESRTMIAGNRLPEVVSVHSVAVGAAICYDLRFPELFRHFARQQADLVIIPSAWYAGTLKEEHWLTLLRARAIENTCYAAGVNQVGSAFCGRSAVFDPFGAQIADAGEGTKLVCVRIEKDRIAEVRSKLPALSHIRRDLFA